MLFLNVSDAVLEAWGRTIDLYYSIHIGSISNEIKSINLLIEEEPLDANHYSSANAKKPQSERTLYRCGLTVVPANGEKIHIVVERENCGAGIEQCFAKAKRTLTRRMRGLSLNSHVA